MGIPTHSVRDKGLSLSNGWDRVSVLTLVLHFALLVCVGLSRHWSFMTSLYDLGVFDQTLWNTTRDDFMVMTSVFAKPMNFLGFHFSPVLVAFVPFYWIAATPEWMVLAQALALSFAGWPLYRLACLITGGERAAFLWLTIYLVNPFVLNAAAWDFHPIALAAPAVTAGMWAVETRRVKLFLGCMIWALLVQEHMGLFVAGFGLLWRLRQGDWLLPMGTVATGLAYSYLVLAFVMPALSSLGGHPMLVSGTGHLARFGWLGATPVDALWMMLGSPIQVLKHAFVDMGGLAYLMALALPLLGLCLAAPEILLPGLADLGANILSANPMPRSIFAYHSVVLATITTTAALYGVRRLSVYVDRYSQLQLTGFVAIASWITGYLLAPVPLPGAANIWKPAYLAVWPDSRLTQIQKALGPIESVSVQPNVGAHFTQFKEVYAFPQKLETVGAVILRLDSPTTTLVPRDQSKVGTLAHHLQLPPDKYVQTVRHLLATREWGVLVWESPWLVLAKGGVADTSTVAAVEKRLDELCTLWQLGSCPSR